LDDFIHIFETMKTSILLYHGSSVPVEHPEIRKSVYTKDFSWGFYCTKSIIQAKRWAIRNTGKGCLNIYRSVPFRPSSQL